MFSYYSGGHTLWYWSMEDRAGQGNPGHPHAGHVLPYVRHLLFGNIFGYLFLVM